MADFTQSLPPSSALYDMTLEEKEAFYKQLNELEAHSDGDDEKLDEPRKQSRDFLERARAGIRNRPGRPRAANTSSKPALSQLTAARSISPTRPLSEMPGTRVSPVAETTPTVIDATPSLQEQGKELNRRRLQTSTSFVQDTPQGSRPATRASLRRTQTISGADPASKSLASSLRQRQPSAMAGPSRDKRLGKAKVNGKESIPEAEKKLKGLIFFYIPGERIKLRKDRMERAEAHGAVVTTNFSEATHVVVDDNLTYEKIKGHLPLIPGKNEPTIVTDQWPLECILRKVVFQPSRKYRPKGTPVDESAPPIQDANLVSQVPNASLELKEPTKKRDRWDYVSPETTQSSTRVVDTTQGPKEPIDQLPGQAGHAESVRLSSQPRLSANEGDNEQGQIPHIQRSSSGFGDELAEIVHQVRKEFKDLPCIEEDDANAQGERGQDKSSGSDSGNDTHRGRRKKRRKKTELFEEQFACNRGGAIDGIEKKDNPNAETISILRKMSEYYAQTNDQWRITSYRKAITVLEKTTDRKITTAEEAMELPGFGPRLSAKLEEIVNTHSLARLAYATNDPMSKVLALFLGIYGVGKTTADKWIAKGFRTLDDLVRKAKLTDSQRLGIDHYEDLNTLIPRTEVTQLGAFVKAEAATIDQSVKILIGGSYRRGANNSGDVDFIITKEGTTSSNDLLPFLNKLIGDLWRQGFLTAEVASHSSNKDGGGSKWHGCCVLPRVPGFNDDEAYRPIWRRIDILLVPESEYGAALIYFTGNDIFNRSMRLLASRKGMRLNQRGLYKDVMRGSDRPKVGERELIEGKDEKKIFEILKVKWREPHERWC
ncbi:unnamed protein product [Discula destructiva]